MLSIRALLLFFFAAISSVAAGSTAEGLAFLNVKKTEEGVISLPSGLMYKEIRAGAGKTPTVDSPCSCNYAGSLIDGTEFDSSYKRGQVSCWCYYSKVSFLCLKLTPFSLQNRYHLALDFCSQSSDFRVD
jgi:hypothetical protein